MTYVGAFKLHGVPLILGDVMLTSNDPQRPKMGNEFNADATAQLNASGRAIEGVRRKIIILNPKFAVAVAGSGISAGGLLARLRREFTNSSPSIDELEGFLDQITDYRGQYKVVLVGWLHDGKNGVCFRWDSDDPEIFDVREEQHAGKGEDAAEVVTSFVRAKVPESGRTIEYYISNMLGECLSRDIGDGEFTVESTGIWFEVVYWDPTIGFKRFSPYFFSWFGIEKTASGEIKPQQPFGYAIYIDKGHESVLQTILPDRGDWRAIKRIRVMTDPDDYKPSRRGSSLYEYQAIPDPAGMHFIWDIPFKIGDRRPPNGQLLSWGQNPLCTVVAFDWPLILKLDAEAVLKAFGHA